MRFAVFIATAALLGAQSPPRYKPADYPVHVQIGTVTIAAEYLVHSLPTPKGTLVARDYLVVEVAFFGPSFSRLNVAADNFSLRINGKGDPLTPELPGIVAQLIKYPETGGHPALTANGGIYGADGGAVTVGPRAPQSRFPGDGNDRTASGGVPSVKEVDEENKVEFRVQSASLPEGEKALPCSGLVYFYFRGKMKNVHTIELLYTGAMGKTSLKLL